jgi:SAM-dependent methyltransferase
MNMPSTANIPRPDATPTKLDMRTTGDEVWMQAPPAACLSNHVPAGAQPAALFAGTDAPIVAEMRVNWDSTARDYAAFRAGFPDEFYDRLAGHGIAGGSGAQQRALDLGTGTGTLARALTLRGWRVTGLDISAEMIGAARRLDAAAGVAVDYIVARSEATGLPAAAFDLIAAGTCWHWFDRPAAAREAHRLLAPHGRLVVAAMEWQSRPGNVVSATCDLIHKHNPHWPNDRLGFRFEWAEDLSNAGFIIADRFEFDVIVPYTHEAWRGRIRASAGVSASLDHAAVDAFDHEHAELLRTQFRQEPLAVPHRVLAIVARKES